MRQAATFCGNSDSIDLHDLRMAESAWHVSGRSCNATCRTYHRVRPLLRCLGLSAEPADQAEFFKTSLTEAIGNGARDILICGTSDTAMPEMALAIADAMSVPVQLHLLDICKTPGQLALEHCQSTPSNLRVETANILNWTTALRFDAIVTHSLLGQFSPDMRPALFAKWHQLLRPGGQVITVNRIRPQSKVRSYNSDTAMALADETVRRYEFDNPGGDIGSDELHRAVMDYCRDRRSHPVESVGQVSGLCTEAGLEIQTLETRKSTPRSAGLTGPAMPDGGTYCHLVAARPIDQPLR